MGELSQTSSEDQAQLDFTNVLVDDTLQLIFGYLSSSDLVSAGHVCRRWWDLAKDSSLWKHRSVVRKHDGFDDKVLRVLQFAPCVDRFDSEFCALTPPGEVESDVRLPGIFEQQIMNTECQIRALLVHSPSVAFIQRFGPTLEELTLATSDQSVLRVVESLSLKALKLRWLYNHDENPADISAYDEALLSLIAKQKNCLQCLYGYRKGLTCSSVMETLSLCTDLQKLWIPLNPHMKPLQRLQHLKKLVLEINSENLHYLSDIAVPHCVQSLSIKVVTCPLGVQFTSTLINHCKKLPSLKSITFRPYVARCLSPPCDLSAFQDTLPGIKLYCHCNCQLEDFERYKEEDPSNEHEYPSEDEGYEFLYDGAEWDGGYAEEFGFDDEDLEDGFDDFSDEDFDME